MIKTNIIIDNPDDMPIFDDAILEQLMHCDYSTLYKGATVQVAASNIIDYQFELIYYYPNEDTGKPNVRLEFIGSIG